MNVFDRFGFSAGDKDPRSRYPMTPVRVVSSFGNVSGEAGLILTRQPQMAIESESGICFLRNAAEGPHAAVLVDFGRELHGSLVIAVKSIRTPEGKTVDLRVRLGESVGEALSPLGEKGACNDHATRDFVLPAAGLSANETPESGFRFAYIELLSGDSVCALRAVTATLIIRDLDYRGKFASSDPLLDRIYDTAAYTVHLNLQRRLWDGIKRDRLVWAGDMNTEIHTALAVFGDSAGVRDAIVGSMNLARDMTPPGGSMNSLSSYSLWWMLCHFDWYMGTGDIDLLREQKEYLCAMLPKYFSYIDENGAETMPGGRFFDWPNRGCEETQHAGLQGFFRYALLRGGALMKTLGEDALSRECIRNANRLRRHHPDPKGMKQVGAMLALSGIEDPKKMYEEVIAPGGAHGLSTFLGYYTLTAAAAAGHTDGALSLIRAYWGRMLEMGATTFWEDFDIDWAVNASRIDEMPAEGKDDVHGDFGAYCYRNFRHSLCYGWASGPAPFLAKRVLGVRPFAPGFGVIRFTPDLGGLEWAKGTVPTPRGDIEVELERGEGGRTLARIEVPDGVKIV